MESVKLITNQNRNQQNYKLKAQGFNMSTSVHLIHIFIYLILWATRNLKVN